MCSDGLSGVVAEPEIARALSVHPELAAGTLLGAALDGNARDNVTLIVIAVPESAPHY
ncbi:MAG: hypothetical protein ACREHV_04805 [Rhizomicrobium sp.]